MTPDYKMAHKDIAEYNGKSAESMRQAKRQWEKDGSGLWPYYVKAYTFDSKECQDKLAAVNTINEKLEAGQTVTLHPKKD